VSPRAAARLDSIGFERVYDYVAGNVVDARRVVLGRLGRSAIAGDGDATVEEAMSPGPSTVRPSMELDRAVERMRAQRLTNVPVTRSDGVLVGVIRRDDAERVLHQS
jgi:Mg/Co/Ni transporter MgtE